MSLQLAKGFDFRKGTMILKEQTVGKEQMWYWQKTGQTKTARQNGFHEWSCETDGYRIFQEKGRKMIAFYIKKKTEYVGLSSGILV